MSLDLADVVDAADVRMRDLARDPDLGVESGEPIGLVRHRVGQELERDGLAELEVVRAVDLAHAAAPEQSSDAVSIDQERARGESAVERTRACRQGHAAGDRMTR